MTGSFGEMGNLLKQAQRMQQAMDEAKKELKDIRLEGTSGGGLVRVTVTAEGDVEKLELGDGALQVDKEGLEELLLAALRDGLSRATRAREERLAKVTGGLNLPGLM